MNQFSKVYALRRNQYASGSEPMRQDKLLHYWHYFFMGFVDNNKKISPAVSTQGAERPTTIKSATYLQVRVFLRQHVWCFIFYIGHLIPCVLLLVKKPAVPLFLCGLEYSQWYFPSLTAFHGCKIGFDPDSSEFWPKF